MGEYSGVGKLFYYFLVYYLESKENIFRVGCVKILNVSQGKKVQAATELEQYF